MADEFQDLQQLWQQGNDQAPPFEAFVERLQAIRHRHRREKLLLSLSFALTIGVLAIMIPISQSIYYAIAMGCIGLAMVLMLWRTYRIRFHPLPENPLQSNKEFLQNYYQSLMKKVALTRKFMWVYAVLLIAGINIGYVEALREYALSLRLSIHIGVTVLLGGIFIYGIRRRLRHYRQEIAPILALLKDMQPGDQET